MMISHGWKIMADPIAERLELNLVSRSNSVWFAVEEDEEKGWPKKLHFL